jgi:uncharacterized protein YjbJ (UPF0337 family)
MMSFKLPLSCTAKSMVRRETRCMKQFTFDNSWDQIKGQLKQRFAQLTDDDLMFAEGKGEEMLARVRQKLNISATNFSEVLEELQDEAGGFIGRVRTKVGEWTEGLKEKAVTVADDVKHRASARADEMRAQANAAYDQARDRALELRDDGLQYVRTNPRKSLVAALCAGFAAGLLMRR